VFIYGPASVGKSFLFSKVMQGFKKIIDCSKFVNFLNSVENIQVLEKYLEMHYKRVVFHNGILILDNINAICPMLSKDS
jgi:predicted AAA+ superfamily ATPase